MSDNKKASWRSPAAGQKPKEAGLPTAPSSESAERRNKIHIGKSAPVRNRPEGTVERPASPALPPVERVPASRVTPAVDSPSALKRERAAREAVMPDSAPKDSGIIRGREIREEPLTHSPLIAVEDWDDDPNNDPVAGLGAEGKRESERNPVKKRRRRTFTANERDVEIIRLLGRFKYGYRTQVEHYCDRKDLSRRLTQLSKAGLLRNEIVTRTQALWTPTKEGLDVAELDVPVLSHGKITPSTIAHTVGLLNLAIDLEKGLGNPLKDENWPYDFRRLVEADGNYTLHRGETIISERMITQSYNRMKAIYGVNEMKRQLTQALAWKGIGFGPEAEEGNEWMFVIMGSTHNHTPDMVLVRPRNSDGSCAHVAIELELSAKQIPDWRRILSAFKGSPVYQTVAYFTHKRTIWNSLTALNAEHVGLEPHELLMRKYVPLNRNIPFWG